MRCTVASRALALVLVPLLSGLGCSLDKGPSGDIPPEMVFPLVPLVGTKDDWCPNSETPADAPGCPEVEGCLEDSSSQGETGGVSFRFNTPFDLTLMEARLEVVRREVVRREADLVLGTENPPSGHFAFGRGAGIQKILVSEESREDDRVAGSPWFVSVISPPVWTPAPCPKGQDPDWRLSVRRSSGIQGEELFPEVENSLAPCTPTDCVTQSFQVEVPDDALSMEFVLESLKSPENPEGDADLIVGLGDEEESLVSLNPGPGYDVVVLDPGRCVPLRGQSVTLVLEGWQQTTEYRLQAAYLAGEPEEQAP
jgi:hypothetical protein